MSKIKEVLRLKYLNKLSNRQIHTMTGVSRNSVVNYVKSFIALGSTLNEVLELSDAELTQLFAEEKPKVNTVKKICNLQFISFAILLDNGRADHHSV